MTNMFFAMQVCRAIQGIVILYNNALLITLLYLNVHYINFPTNKNQIYFNEKVDIMNILYKSSLFDELLYHDI